MESIGVNVIEAAALGRPFQLGMLYDCRKDALVPGITLWNQEKLHQSIRSRPQINTDFKVTASDSIEEKSHLLNIGGSLKLSLLGGLINVTGAAKYLNDTKNSFIQQRLTLHYHSTTRFEELTMNHLASENIAHRDVFDRDTATHVVTAVLYGADACFVFDREVSSDENKTTVGGEVKAAFNKLKFITVDVNANLNMTDAQRKAVEKFSVTFYGDFQLPSNPTSFEDAMKVFADLPKLLGENRDLSVPLRVWLYPLDKLHSKASKLLKEISLDLISDIESTLESLNTTEMKCCDLLRDSPALALPAFHNQIKDMKKNCYTYKLRLMKKLGSLLPQIRGDQIKDSELTDLLNDHDESPFRESELEEWLKERERESEVMKTLLGQLKDSGATVENNLQAILMDLNIGIVVSYTFTSLDWLDVLLSKQETHLRPLRRGNSNDNDPESKKNLSWLTLAIHKTMRKNLEIFKNLVDSKDRKPATFIVSSKEMEDQPGSCILLYENGCVEGVCFTPPSKPAPPITAEVKGDGVIVNVPPSTCPATEQLKLLYKMKHEQVWTSQPVLKSQDTVTLTDLRAGTEYEIKCAAVGKLSYTTESDVITVISDSQGTSEITRSLAEMLVKDFRPISTVEDTGFVALVKTLEPQYQIPSREQLKYTIIQMYDDCKAKVMTILQKASRVTLTIERWTLRSTETYLTVSGHFINNWQVQQFVLETISLTAQHTDDDISLELKRITDEWGITDKVMAVVTGGVEILVSAVCKAGWQHKYCLARVLNSLVVTAIYDCSEVIQLLIKCETIVSFFHQSTEATEMLRQVQQQLKVPENKRIISDDEWWNSMFCMLERLYEQREAVNKVLGQLEKKDLCFTETEVSLINQTLETLRPFEKASRELLREKYVSLSEVFPIALDLLTATDNQQDALTRELRNRCQITFRGIEHLAVYTFLDIRYKSVEYFNKDIMQNVKKKLFSKMQNIHLPSSAPAPSPASTSACPSDSQVLSVEHQPFTSNDLKTEMCRYEKEKAIPSAQNPLDWWKTHERTYPSLSQIAKRDLGVIATCVPLTIMFSEAGHLMRKKRDRLEEEDVDIFLFLHQNLQ